MAPRSSHQSHVYAAVYSGIPVFEMMSQNVAVMRRRLDSFLNATQILKVAGIEKGKRTKILEKEIMIGDHEKVQGGYGKYQGTWVPFERGLALAKQYEVDHLLQPLFEFNMGPGSDIEAPTKEQFLSQNKLAKSAAGSSSIIISSRRLSKLNSSAGSTGSPFKSSSVRVSRERRAGRSAHRSSDDDEDDEDEDEDADDEEYEEQDDDDIPPEAAPCFQDEEHAGLAGSAYSVETDDGSLSVRRSERNMLKSALASSVVADEPIEVTQDVQMESDDDHESSPRSPGSDALHARCSPLAPARDGRDGEPDLLPATKRMRMEDTSAYSYNGCNTVFYPPVHSFEYAENSMENYRAILLAGFLHDDPGFVPEILTSPDPLPGFDPDVIIDDQGHSALHWAAALARVPILELLLKRKSNPRQVNHCGESALVRAVLFINNYDHQTFGEVLDLLEECIPLVDKKKRTLMHHIANISGYKGRRQAARYYMECLLHFMAENSADFAAMVDLQDKNGDTALNIAARMGDRSLVEQLLNVGANPNISNLAGLRPVDFGYNLSAPFTPRFDTSGGAQTTQLLGKRHHQDTAHQSSDQPSAIPASTGSPFSSAHKTDMTGAIPLAIVDSSGIGTIVKYPTLLSCDEVMETDTLGSTSNDSAGSDQTTALPAFAPAHAAQHAKVGQEIVSTVQSMIDAMSTTFSNELAYKEELLATTRQQLRDMVKELAELRATNETLRQQALQVPELLERISNLTAWLKEAADSKSVACTDGLGHLAATSSANEGGVGGLATVDIHSEIAQLRQRLEMVQKSEQQLLSELVELKSCCSPKNPPVSRSGSATEGCETVATGDKDHRTNAKGANGNANARVTHTQQEETANQDTTMFAHEQAGDYFKYKRIVAKCCQVDYDKVDSLLPGLLAAVETDQHCEPSQMAHFLGWIKQLRASEETSKPRE
ncbi:uncharacterized protein BJ171DRAFT_597535 [Polychytrium aggregatum]|uniref:uncharacterized protein n=1 Tax=Polychytrium aggregatum TaxID=110093 RepID=UPI0022FEB935|nr:uncharacterized protein BJ171DRAFT_597535 [Polychytrium aggregatum]KAI9206374.1 hypothetical protein BJ171DRAFT_597535 [Polychytrium aggregatum]